MGGHAAPRVGSRLESAARPAVNPPRPSGERTCKCGAIYARFSFESSKSELRRGCLRRAQQPQQHLQAAQQQRSANHTRTSGAAVSAQMSSLHNKHRMLTCSCRGALRASGAKRKLLPFGHGRSTLEETRGKSGHLRALRLGLAAWPSSIYVAAPRHCNLKLGVLRVDGPELPLELPA